MTTTIPTSASVTAGSTLALNVASTATDSSSSKETADRFLKLLVTQLQNQDPLNPMDNAAVTSQIAQINTVNGIEKLNTTVGGLSQQFSQLQAISGAALVGRDVTVVGNRLAVQGGVGLAGFDLNGTASSVQVEILDEGGRLLTTVDLGPQAEGRHGFEWDATGVADGAKLQFRINAKNGTAAVPSSALMLDHVRAVSARETGLVIETQYSGSVAYSDVKAFN